MDKIRRKNVQKVVVAMSGGIDSSVAAALLKKEGYDLIGVFIKFWSEPEKDGLIGKWNSCCSPEAENRARKVAEILSIPFYVFNFEKEFKKRIVNYFLAGYKKGITPNPCVVCNKEVKFGLLLEKALKLEADYIATGHYACLRREISKDSYKLLKAKDKNKDQSYFLWMLDQKQLEKVLLPIGNYTKKEVKMLAKKFGLPVFDDSESMEICFIKTTVNEFLSRYLRPKPGSILTAKGEKVGEHQGLFLYTIGQRKGIKLAKGPYFVLDKNLKKNSLIVTKNEDDLYKKELTAEKVKWLSGKSFKNPLRARAKIRYRHKPALATIRPLESNIYRLIFDKPQRAITPGQSVVFYKGQEVLGGGIIKSSNNIWN